ncbi:MAG: T9SS type A sorting domain-containing protein [Bacteroidota bacterium]
MEVDPSVNVTSISVFDVNGKQQLAQSPGSDVTTEIALDVAQLSSGIYFLKVNSDSGSATLKFVKQ